MACDGYRRGYVSFAHFLLYYLIYKDMQKSLLSGA